MPPPLLFSLEGIDLDKVLVPIEEIRKVNPQRYEMEQLTGIIHLDREAGRLVAERRVGTDEWWVKGHIPGRPLMPGVLIIESAAQACAYLYKALDPAEKRFIGFGGLEEVKQELREAVEWPLKYPEKFKELGIRPPKGVLLYGPPGCGKTLLAKAVATESEANFIAVRGPELMSKWVGETERGIREVFRKARTAAPAIIFFDEIDALVPRRGMGYADSGVTERAVSQLLTEMDGIATLEDVVVIGATNRPDILDPAILRPGRFDRLIYVPPPDEEARLEIFKIHTRNMPLADDVDLARLARMTEGYSGADIEAVCREAAMNALRRDINAKQVTWADFEAALKKVGPSITPEVERWYKAFAERMKMRVEKPSIPTLA